MYEESISLLIKRGIQIEKGITVAELKKIEILYDIEFPKSLREFLMVALPISNGFYNWRNMERENVKKIKLMIAYPMQYISNRPEDVYWCDDWGEEPEDEECRIEEVRKQFSKAPKLIPVYSHRYMPMTSEGNPPIISVHGTDVVYYGKNLEDYFKIEFGEKRQEEIDFYHIKPILFWSDII